MKVLIVDDSKTIRTQIKEMLPTGKFEVLEAQDGLEALDVVAQARPQLILLDFFMPRMNGWEVVQTIQNHPTLHHIPIVMMSGRREDVEKTVPELFDYFEFLGKPFAADVLIRAIKRAHAKAKQRQQVVEPEPSNSLPFRPADYNPPPIQPETPFVTTDALEVRILKADLQALQTQHIQLKTELDDLKRKMAQVLLLLRQLKP
ncbi:MAG: response regulator [Leptolyngbyaceae cyanobacterium SL_7_1]|nr:response regulator [Leptolyngbyaceae cyanobacterium SL_7_1]